MFVVKPAVTDLCTHAHTVAVGTVESIEPTGIETKLSYPTIGHLTFRWQRVRFDVAGIVKGEPAARLDVGMLDVERPAHFANGPLMIEPQLDDKFVLFVAPAMGSDMFVAILAPYWERNAVIRLDREKSQQNLESLPNDSEVDDIRREYEESRDMVWMLIDDTGAIQPDGIEQFRSKYAGPLREPWKGDPIALEWKTHTSKSGWSYDVPKDT